MSASNNTESLVNQGEFSSRVPPAEPLADGSWASSHPSTDMNSVKMKRSLT